MKKLMVILITGLLYMSCTDSMEVSGDADRNNTVARKFVRHFFR